MCLVAMFGKENRGYLDRTTETPAATFLHRTVVSASGISFPPANLITATLTRKDTDGDATLGLTLALDWVIVGAATMWAGERPFEPKCPVVSDSYSGTADNMTPIAMCR